MNRDFGEQRNVERVDSNVALHHINQLLEEQSKRISQAVHNELGQLLISVFTLLDEASRDLSPSCRERFIEIRVMLKMIEVQLCEIAYDLRPTELDDLGLVAAIEGHVDKVSRRHRLPIHFRNALGIRLDSRVEIALYRIVQESLNNAIKHACATSMSIEISNEDGVAMVMIADNGVGFDINEVLSRKGSRGLGLVGIRERAASVGGALSIVSVPGNGTTLYVTIPVRGENCKSE
jgi:two-component system sensor histidine kinase DegS